MTRIIRAILIALVVVVVAVGVARCAEPNAPPARTPACFIRMPDGHAVPIYEADQCWPNSWTPPGK